MQNRFRFFLLPLILVLLVTGVQAKNGGGKSRMTHESIKLKATNSKTNVGVAEVLLKAKKKRTDQSFHLKLNNVPANSSFTLMVDGKAINTFTTSPNGTFDILFGTNSKGSNQPLPVTLNPVTSIKHVEIKGTTGQTVAGGAFGDDEGDTEKEIALTTTGIIPGARGEAKIEIEKDDGDDNGNDDGDDDGNDDGDDDGDDDGGHGDDGNTQMSISQSFELEVESLTASTTFALFVDGNQVLTFTTDREGSAELEFSSNPEDEEQPLPPALSSLANIKLVEIRTTDGKVVLMGSF